MVSGDETIALFSYGTLQLPAVQRATYGRLLVGEPDVLRGYRLIPLDISDAGVARLSGKSVHTLAVASDNSDDCIAGILFRLTPDELEASDAYEVDAYKRLEVLLESGRNAWVYVGSAKVSGP